MTKVNYNTITIQSNYYTIQLLYNTITIQSNYYTIQLLYNPTQRVWPSTND